MTPEAVDERCELGDPDCEWRPGLEPGEYRLCWAHFVRLTLKMPGLRRFKVWTRRIVS
jgi:hypothetical protein